ncbi:hypothetical protein DSLASN_47850 [Desulfoluna limicola]|uniref:Chalcone isomerase domain-containing protein n=2 Tax=Desulfoluna limicola TaxID=2810562 RepID=A0ABM7PPF2_9BACT|nr:hypothetical protein DSLASN_47850 [Desulfoluna limicola]
MSPIKHLFPAIALVLITVFSAHALEPAATIDEVRFALSYQVGEERLKLRGVASLRYLKFIKAYAGGLYMPENVRSDDVLSDVPKRLVLEYFQTIEAEDFADATRKMVEKNTDTETLSRIAPALDRLCLAYKTVVPKDRYALTYVPEKGLDLSLNGALLGTFEGADFARAMFSIWIGPNPIDKRFRNRLLGPQ